MGSPDQPRDDQGRWTTGSGGADHFVAKGLHGIDEVTLSRTGNVNEARANLKLLRSAAERDSLGYMRGIGHVDMTATSLPGYASFNQLSGEMKVNPTRMAEKTPQDQTRVILHEAGHHGQLETDKSTFRDFESQGLGRHAPEVIRANYSKSRWGGETFAESYGRYSAGIKQAPELDRFWASRGARPGSAPPAEKSTKEVLSTLKAAKVSASAPTSGGFVRTRTTEDVLRSIKAAKLAKLAAKIK